MMMPRPKPGDLLGLVDVDKGIVSREIFVNEEIYRQEQERMFARAWLFVGHESQITRPGDYLVSSMGEESVILCRDRAGRIHVFLNSCRHRGMKVCRYDEGNTVEFTCPYHGWSYATDGALVGVPFAKDAYGEHLDRSRWGLVEVAQLESYKGTVWATWDPSAPSFLEYLGGYKLYLDLLLDAWDGREGGTEVIGGIHKWLIPCNWKFPAENFSGDRYRHQPPVGRHGRHRPERQGPARHAGAQRGALARRHLPRSRPLEDRVPAESRRADRARVSGRARSRRLLQAVRGGAPAPPRRILAPLRRAGHGVPERVAARTPAAHARRLASARAAPDRVLAHLPR